AYGGIEKKTNRGNIDKRHKEQFVSWFERKMNILHADGKTDQDIYSLSRGPDHRVRVANRSSINGSLFHTTNVEKNLTTQNNGVVVQGEGMDWYEVTKKIIALDFPIDKEVLLFECDWFDVPGATTNKSRGYSKDQYGIIDIDTTRFRFKDEPYILASQAQQVCYVKCAKKNNWCSVLRMKPWNLFAMPEGKTVIIMLTMLMLTHLS
uniref:DUF4216 domain-containing protein n=1 Tax=Oryza glaberrima TaxID=4538 RepID=I1QZM3_ORYGL